MAPSQVIQWWQAVPEFNHFDEWRHEQWHWLQTHFTACISLKPKQRQISNASLLTLELAKHMKDKKRNGSFTIEVGFGIGLAVSYR